MSDPLADALLTPDPVRTSAPPTVTRAEAERGRWIDLTRPLALAVLTSRARRILVDGPLGTGKTRLNLEKVRACCLKYPGCRWVLLRSVRKWLTHSARRASTSFPFHRQLAGSKTRKESTP